MPINVDQAVTASAMAKRVLRGNAADGEMDFVRGYASLDIPQFCDTEVDGVGDVPAKREERAFDAMAVA